MAPTMPVLFADDLTKIGLLKFERRCCQSLQSTLKGNAAVLVDEQQIIGGGTLLLLSLLVWCGELARKIYTEENDVF